METKTFVALTFVVLTCGTALGIAIEAHHETKLKLSALQYARNVGYRDGFKDGVKALGWLHNNCSTMGSGDVTLIVCKGAAR